MRSASRPSAVFVDSSVWIDHLRGTTTPETEMLRWLIEAGDAETDVRPPTEVLVGDLVLLEVLRGIADDIQYERTRAALLSFPYVGLGGQSIALAAAQHYRRLRRSGITIRKSVDCMIAAWCIARDIPLLHRDRDFEPFVTHCGLREFKLDT